MTALAAAKGTYKVAVQTGAEAGMFGAGAGKVYVTLHDEAGASTKEYKLDGELQEGEGPGGGPDVRISSQGEVKGRWWDSKDTHFDAGTTDYFFLETGISCTTTTKTHY